MTWGILGGLLVLVLRIVSLFMRAQRYRSPVRNDVEDTLRALRQPPPKPKPEGISAKPKGWQG